MASHHRWKKGRFLALLSGCRPLGSCSKHRPNSLEPAGAPWIVWRRPCDGCQMMLMEARGCDATVRRPWTALAATLTAAHHGFELSSGVGLVGQPKLGLVGAGALWGAQIPIWIALAAKGGKRWDGLLSLWSGAALGGAVVHFLIWPCRRSALGIPVLAEAEGLGASQLPVYNSLLYAWAAAAVLSIAHEVPRRERRWALLGFATLPLLRRPAKHHFSWIVDQAAARPAWWNRGVQGD